MKKKPFLASCFWEDTSFPLVSLLVVCGDNLDCCGKDTLSSMRRHYEAQTREAPFRITKTVLPSPCYNSPSYVCSRQADCTVKHPSLGALKILTTGSAAKNVLRTFMLVLAHTLSKCHGFRRVLDPAAFGFGRFKGLTGRSMLVQSVQFLEGLVRLR